MRMYNFYRRNKKAIFLILAIIAAQAATLLFLGRPGICECGYVKLWVSEVLSPEMSQHLTDWYTFSHVIHGFLFYFLFRWLFPRLTMWHHLAMAVGLEVAWEIAENTPWVIEAYREQALAQGYAGDSVINSVFDTLAMTLGFIFARRFPVWLTVSLAIVMEVAVAYYIRDNLTLNILNFIYPFDFIHRWQSGG